MKWTWFGLLALAFACGYAVVGMYETRTTVRRPLEAVFVAEDKVELPLDGTADAPATTIQFHDIADTLGVDFRYFDGAAGQYYIFETTGGGAAVADFDLDGTMDLFFVNGSVIPTDAADRRHLSSIYFNKGPAGFEERALEAGVDALLYGHAACASDFDNDGFQDLFLTGFGRTILFRNRGDGTFEDVTLPAKVGLDTLGTSAAFADLDRDGDLDLYCANYAIVSLENPLVCKHQGKQVHCDPKNYTAQLDTLFENLGDGTFRDASASLKCEAAPCRGFGVVIADLDGDGLPDVFVANDQSTNLLYLNQGELHFKESAFSMGCAITGQGRLMAGMGAACADYDHNGFLDLFVTNFYRDTNILYAGSGANGFLDQSDSAGLGHTSYDRLGWGAIFLDADLDGFDDLFVANGHVSEKEGEPHKMRPQFYRNRGNGTFEELTDSMGAFFQKPELGRGTARGDFENDGRPDLVSCHIGSKAAVLQNRTQPVGGWIGLDLIGARSARDGWNAKISYRQGNSDVRREVSAGNAFLSSSDRRLILGLGSGPTPAEIVVEWPSGARQVVASPTTGAYQVILEPR